MTLAGHHIAVLGLGASGRGAARLAGQRGARVTLFDSGSGPALAGPAAELDAEGISVKLGATGPAPNDRFDLAVLSPGIDPLWDLPKAFAAARVPVIGEIEFAWRHQDKPVVAITGTNGKSTTTELVARLLTAGGLRTVPAGNHGRAFSDVLWAGDPIDVHTLEVSSFQLETIESFRPRVAVWMNFAPDHLDRHPSLEAYFAAKARIFENQGPGDTAVVKLEDRRPATPPERTVTLSAHSEGADYGFDGRWISHRGDRVLDFSNTRLRGRHNAENLMAALAVGRALGVDWSAMGAAAREYRAPRHRCELVAVVEGREFINDSKATNLHALESCLRSLPDPVVLIAGGKDKGLDFSPMRALVRAHVTHVLAIGQLRPHLADAWGGLVPVEACDSLESAVARGLEVSRPGQIVLLSPGTSSFDMFSGYEDRGDRFVRAVHRLLSPV
ncbi:MAG: UDP-N-acetylmuramoyl-L-alanine--D-glutamate ligase [Verrucomicrobiales bacterium]